MIERHDILLFSWTSILYRYEVALSFLVGLHIANDWNTIFPANMYVRSTQSVITTQCIRFQHLCLDLYVLSMETLG
ncbi:hypothetical protein M413DRAFT_196782 [Hebeloma cylindrosporum]|uniref:Uncharacterized protein n=1 Tax=Hebeloma cylindrosporum TaxID=76867 RepID=A0A0C3C6S4_HEBCY|nr:hypothetical protein M413DRAFT_196782 [Hebeloma cylindrosporum h7]